MFGNNFVMKKMFFIIVAFLIFLGCRSDDRKENVVMLAQIEIDVVNSLGENLFDPQHPNTLDLDEIKVYHLDEQGEKRLKIRSKAFSILPPEEPVLDRYLMCLFLNTPHYQKSNPTYTYVDFGDGVEYEIKTLYYQTNNITTYQQLWLNGEPVTFEDMYPNTSLRIIRIQK